MPEYRTRRTPSDIGAEPVPIVLGPSIARAKARTMKRSHGPLIMLERGPDGEKRWSWPWSDDPNDQGADWKWLVMDTFGTRSSPVAAAFLGHLQDVCRDRYWDDEAEEWVPDEGELQCLLHIVTAHRPANEAQAALAAQMAVTHMITMKLGAHVAKHPFDTRSIGAYANLARASAAQIEAMSTIKGRKRTAKQVIEVKHVRHVHHHKHVHFEAGGGPAGDGQPQGTIVEGGPPKNGGSAALPCSDTGGRILPIAGGPRSPTMQAARVR